MKFQNSDENRFFIPIDGIAWYWLVLQGYWLVFHGVVWHIGELPCGASCKVPLTFLGGKSKFVIVPMHLVLACYALPASSTDSVLASPKRDACLELSVQSKSVVYVWHIAQIPMQVQTPSGQYRQ